MGTQGQFWSLEANPLRIAVLAMTETVGTEFPLPRAFLRVGGASIARHQLALAIALDCQRVICVARAVAADLLALQHDAEAAGIQFHLANDARGVTRLVTAADEVIVLADGLLVDVAPAAALLDTSHVVLSLPADAGTAAGFERIDLDNAAAGAMRIPGRFVDALANLPPDCDVPSALTRIALQGGVPMRAVPEGMRGGVQWRLVRDDGDAHAIEGEWLRAHIGRARTHTPGPELARLAVQAIGPTLLNGGHASRTTFAGAIVLFSVALVLAWFSMSAPGLAVAAVGWVTMLAGAMLRRVERGDRGDSDGDVVSPATVIGIIGDFALIALVVRAELLQPWDSLIDRAFAPIMLVLLLRMLARTLPLNLAMWAADRTIVLAGLAIVAALGWLTVATQILALILAAVGIVLSRGPRS